MPPKTCPQANLMEEFSQLRILFSDDPNLRQVDKKLSNPEIQQ